MSHPVRKWTNLVMEAMDEGMLDARAVADMCLVYMSEADVQGMCQANELQSLDRSVDDDEEEELDPMDDFNYVGSRHHY